MAGIAGVALIRRGLVAADPPPPAKSWPALQKVLDELVAERRGAGIGVGICFGDGPPACYLGIEVDDALEMAEQTEV